MTTIVIYLIAIALAIKWPRSKRVGLLVLALLAAIAMGNYSNADYTPYEIQYNNIDELMNFHGDSIGYQCLVNLGNYFGLNFHIFRSIMIIVSLLLLYYVCSRVTSYPSLLLVTLVPFPLVYDIVQFRYFLASSIALGSLVAIDLENANLRKTIMYVLLILLASTIHPATSYFFIFLLTKIPWKKLFAVCIGIVCVGSLCAFTGFIEYVAAVLLTPERATAYFGKGQGLGALLAIAIVMANVALCVIQTRNNEKSNYAGQAENILSCHYIAKIAIAYLPLSILLIFDVSSIFRIFRCALGLFVAPVIEFVFNRSNESHERSLILARIIWWAAVLVLGFSMHTFATTYGSVIYSNYLNMCN